MLSCKKATWISPYENKSINFWTTHWPTSGLCHTAWMSRIDVPRYKHRICHDSHRKHSGELPPHVGAKLPTKLPRAHEHTKTHMFQSNLMQTQIYPKQASSTITTGPFKVFEKLQLCLSQLKNILISSESWFSEWAIDRLICWSVLPPKTNTVNIMFRRYLCFISKNKKIN